MPCTKHGHAFDQSPSRQEEPVTNKSRETRLERARPHVMLLAACLVYLTTTLLAFQISIVSVSNLIWPEYARVYDELRAHSSALRKEQIVYSRLEHILATQLDRGFMETYEDCLVRGLKEANYELIGLGFRYPDVREQIIDWTTENCGRLQYAPQVVSEKTTPQEAVLTYWTTLSYNARQIAEEALGFVKQKLEWVLSHLVGSSQHEEASLRTDNATAEEGVSTDEPVSSKRVLPQVPFGFALDCQVDQPCRLFYSRDSTTHPSQPSASPELLDKLEKRSAELLAFGSTLNRFGMAITKVSRAVSHLEMAFLFLYALVFVKSVTAKTGSSSAHQKEEGAYLIRSMMLEHISTAAVFMLDKYPGIIPSIIAALVFAFFMTVIGLNMILKLFIPGSQLETVSNIHMSLRDLYLIAKDSDMAEVYASAVAGQGDGKQEAQYTNTDAKNSSSDSEGTLHSSGACLPSKPHHRLANPTTTIQQDLRHIRQIVRQTRVDQTVEDSTGFDVDAGSDGDGDNFVHAAGDVTREAHTADSDPAWLVI